MDTKRGVEFTGYLHQGRRRNERTRATARQPSQWFVRMEASQGSVLFSQGAKIGSLMYVASDGNRLVFFFFFFILCNGSKREGELCLDCIYLEKGRAGRQAFWLGLHMCFSVFIVFVVFG